MAARVYHYLHHNKNTSLRIKVVVTCITFGITLLLSPVMTCSLRIDTSGGGVNFGALFDKV